MCGALAFGDLGFQLFGLSPRMLLGFGSKSMVFKKRHIGHRVKTR